MITEYDILTEYKNLGPKAQELALLRWQDVLPEITHELLLLSDDRFNLDGDSAKLHKNKIKTENLSHNTAGNIYIAIAVIAGFLMLGSL